MRCCGLTRYGLRELILAALTLGGLFAVLAYLAATISPLIWPAVVVPVALWFGVLWFFRDPDRAPPDGEHLFVSPADGVVADITNVGADSPLGRNGVKIGIFMSIFNVHVNRSPAAGCVERVEHMPGAFLDVRDPLAAEKNESTTIHLRHTHGGREFLLVVRQVAGLIARRIVTDLREGESIGRGQRIGMIKFGSRLELLVPDELVEEVRVSVGDKTVAGMTVLAAAPQEHA